ncbi:hypothetical protein GCM10009846_17420 [Agrococcus versicolor]|uniref:DUF4352 domain-containing protein n=1 Tax=Agrococcus versicolor TaxID=501482 RepID=A0ABN3ARZ8_9MICO
MARLLPAVVALLATAALTGCVVLPQAPPPPVTPPQPAPTQPSPAQPSPAQPSATPGQPAPSSGESSAEVDGSTVTATAEGITWTLELLALEPAPLDALVAYGEDEGTPAPPAPEGMEVGWACFRATLVAAPEDYAYVLDVAEFTVPGGEDGWDYEVAELDEDLYAAGGSVGEVIERTCPVMLVPDGFDYAAVTVLVENGDADPLEAVVPAP